MASDSVRYGRYGPGDQGLLNKYWRGAAAVDSCLTFITMQNRTMRQVKQR